MRVLVAPDKFAGTLTAVQAAEAIARGWARHAPADHLDLAPMADGGPGFLDVLHTALGGELAAVTVRGPFGEAVPAGVLRVGERAYVESAQACGLHLTGGKRAEEASTYGVGQLVAAAIEAGATEVVVGLGGSGTNDGGAGALGALGATADVALDAGAAGLAGVTTVDLAPARTNVDGVRLVAASDVDNPLTGLFGATKTYGPQKGLDDGAPPGRRRAAGGVRGRHRPTYLARARCWSCRRPRLRPLGLGAARQPGIDLVVAAVGLPARARAADLVVTGEGSFDFSSRAGKVPYGVAQVAADAIRPCVALAGRVLVGAREMRALGIEAAHSLVDLVGEERALAAPAEALEDLAERLARSWSRPAR